MDFLWERLRSKNLSLLDSMEIFILHLQEIALSAIFKEEGGKRSEKVLKDKGFKFFNRSHGNPAF